jgi:hypothetical protein
LFLINFLLEAILKKEATLRKLILISFSVMAVIFPNYELGQRDPLMAVFILPYALLICYRLQGQEPKTSLTLLVGMMAACGIALKPVFLVPWLLLEGYYYSQHKVFHKLIRSELLTIIGFFAGYAVILIWFYPHFLTVVAPFCWRWIHKTTNMPLAWLITGPAAVYSYFILLLFATQYRHSLNKNLTNVLAMLTLGTLFTFIFQRNFWWYHQVPLYTFDVLLSVVLFYQYINRQTDSQRDMLSMILFLTAFTIYLEMSYPQIPFLLNLSPFDYFAFLSVLTAVVQLLIVKNINLQFLKLTTLSIGAVALVVLAASLLQTYNLGEYRFAITIILMAFLFKFVAPRWIAPTQCYLIIWLGVLLFIHPCILAVFDSGHSQSTSATSKLVNALQPFVANKSVYVLSSVDILPHKNLPNTTYASRFPAFWLATGMYTPDYPTDKKHLQQREADRNYLINMVAEDLNENKPDIVLVDLNPHKNEFFTYAKNTSSQSRIYFGFDFIDSFSVNPNFKTAFKPYHQIMTVYHQYCRIAVYERSPDTSKLS